MKNLGLHSGKTTRSGEQTRHSVPLARDKDCHSMNVTIRVMHCQITWQNCINHKWKKKNLKQKTNYSTKLFRAQNTGWPYVGYQGAENSSSIKPDSTEQTNQKPHAELIEDQRAVLSSGSNCDLILGILKWNFCNSELWPKYFQKGQNTSFSVQVILEPSVLKGGKTFQI